MSFSLTTEQYRNGTKAPEYGREEVRREGFPKLTPAEFVVMFCRTHVNCYPDSPVQRIEFQRFTAWDGKR